jgi:hypothetical protein
MIPALEYVGAEVSYSRFVIESVGLTRRWDRWARSGERKAAGSAGAVVKSLYLHVSLSERH